MKQCRDNCLCWQLANRFVQGYWQTHPSLPSPKALQPLCVSVPVFDCVCLYCVCVCMPGRLHGSIDCYIRDIAPDLGSDFSPSQHHIFLFPCFLLCIKETQKIVPVGQQNVHTITGARSICSYKLLQLFSWFQWADSVYACVCTLLPHSLTVYWIHACTHIEFNRLIQLNQYT